MKQTLETTINQEEVFSVVRTSLDSVGKVKNANPSDLSLKGSSTYGLQTISVNIKIFALGNGSSIEIETKGDDVFGVGAKKTMEKLLPEIEKNLKTIKDEINSNKKSARQNTDAYTNSDTSVFTNFDSKSFLFDTGASVSVTREKVTAKAENGSNAIDSKNLDSISYLAINQPKLSPIGMASRVILVGWVVAFVLMLAVKDEWTAMFFKSSPKDIFFFWLSIAVFLVSFLLAGFIWLSFGFDIFLETGIYQNIILKYFSNHGYRVTIGNKSGNNIIFIANQFELSKINNLEKKLDELKRYLEYNHTEEKPLIQKSSSNNLDDLKKLGELYQNGILSKDEFEKKKMELLNR